MAKKGRKPKYETHVKPHFGDIEKWLNGGASEEQVALALGISYASFNNYKRDYIELRELCEKPRVPVVLELRSALVKRALGMKVKKVKKYTKTDENGNEVEYTEAIIDELPPDVAAINLALKNLDRQNWANDPQALEIKKQELELRKLMAESKDW